MAKVILLSLFISGCLANPHNLKIGMIVTNGYCTGQLADIIDNRGKLEKATCGTFDYEHMYIELDELRELSKDSNNVCIKK